MDLLYFVGGTDFGKSKLTEVKMLNFVYLKYKICFNPKHTRGGGKYAPPPLHFFFVSLKIFPTAHDKTVCKFLLFTSVDSSNEIWSKKLSRGHVGDIYVAWVENGNYENLHNEVIFVFYLSIFGVKNANSRIMCLK